MQKRDKSVILIFGRLWGIYETIKRKLKYNGWTIVENEDEIGKKSGPQNAMSIIRLLEKKPTHVLFLYDSFNDTVALQSGNTLYKVELLKKILEAESSVCVICSEHSENLIKENLCYSDKKYKNRISFKIFEANKMPVKNKQISELLAKIIDSCLKK